MKTSELIALLVKQLAENGDKLVTGVIPEYGEWESEAVRHDPKSGFCVILLR